MGRFRVYFVSDLHGSEVSFRKFLNSAPVYEPDLLIYGGDILGKTLVPIFHEENGGYRWYPSGHGAHHLGDAELPDVQKKIADTGRYSLVTRPEEWAHLQGSPDQMEATFARLAKERLRHWLGLVRERLTPKKIPVVMNVGNDDTNDVLDLLRSEGPENLLVPEGRVLSVGPYEIFGCGYANMTPWHCPRDLEEPELQKVLDRTRGQIGNPRRTILDIHAPPFGTSLDIAPQLDADFKPQTVSGQLLTHHVGSTSVRELIESVHPIAGLHGHIHESKAVDTVAGVPVYNPGSVYFSGQLQGLLVDFEDDHVLSHLFVLG
ncbi:MAG: metallophosphoesterase [Thermoplasmata archaeon]|nr:metallophosphoesterase [Thermoplasmata archaeon]